MPPKASSSGSSSAGGRRRRRPPAAAAGSTGAAASAAGASSAPAPQPEPSSQPDSFAAEKLQWALAVPPEQRHPSVQAFIDSCECTTEATRLLAAAPLAQLPGPAKLRALLLLLKAHWNSVGQCPAVPGLDLLPASSGWPVPQQARSNLHELVTKVRGTAAGQRSLACNVLPKLATYLKAVSPRALCLTAAVLLAFLQDPSVPHPELQPLYAVAATAAHAMLLSGMATLRCQVASLANSRAELISHGIHSRQLAEQFEHRAPMSLDDPAGLLEGLVRDIRRLGPLLQHQLAGVVGGVLNVRQMEREILKWLGIMHTWAATPDGAYCGGRINEQHAAAGRAAFSAALELSAKDCCTAGVLSGLSNLLRRTGAVAEAEAVLRRAVAAARAAGDAFCELNTASTLASVIPIREGWSYREMEGLVASMQRCLQDCKPWIPGAAWSTYREVRLSGACS